jgi:malate dehydrogenase (oxaloacetate-decarboxylating)
VQSKVRLRNRKDLSLAYTPGVAEASKAIANSKKSVYKYTGKGNLVAVVSDGSAVLGLGNIGAEAALPVMEGKCVLFKELAGIDAFPICLKSQDAASIINTVKNIAPVFGGINLEDIAAPKCFEIEETLKKSLEIPVMHDDQQGTAVVVLAALINALKVVKKNKEDIKVVISGAGAAGVASMKIFLKYGVENIVVCDSKGIIHKGRGKMDSVKKYIAAVTNKEQSKGSLEDALMNADLFLGVSAPKLLTPAMVKKMNPSPVIFAMANPVPEIMPDEAKRAGAAIVATGRSDFPNQINNSLGFPGIFRGALDVRARKINEEMKLAAAYALAGLIKNPTSERIMPDPLDKNVVKAIASAVAKAAKNSGVTP